MRDMLVLALVLGALPFACRHTWVGVLLWTWISVMNPHKLAWAFAMDMPTSSMMSSGCSSSAAGTAHVNRTTMTMTGSYNGSNSCTGSFTNGQMTMTRR